VLATGWLNGEIRTFGRETRIDVASVGIADILFGTRQQAILGKWSGCQMGSAVRFTSRSQAVSSMVAANKAGRVHSGGAERVCESRGHSDL